jgi:integrase/recombinase XerD
MTQLAPHLATFLREHLPRERRASIHTCDAYARSFQLLVTFATQRLRKRPSQLQIEDLDVSVVLAFLQHVEDVRSNKARSSGRSDDLVASFSPPRLCRVTIVWGFEQSHPSAALRAPLQPSYRVITH